MLRTLPFWIVLQPLGDLPGSEPIDTALKIVAGVLVVDSMLILGATRRCGHDRIAGTHVASLTSGGLAPEQEAADWPPAKRKKKKKRRAKPAAPA